MISTGPVRHSSQLPYLDRPFFISTNGEHQMIRFAYALFCFAAFSVLGTLVGSLILLWHGYGLPRWLLWRANRERARRHELARKYGLVPFYSKKDRIIKRDAIDQVRGQYTDRVSK